MLDSKERPPAGITGPSKTNDETETAMKPDREAKMIHDLATDPPPKDIASIKAASDVFEANTDDQSHDRKKKAAAHS